MLRELVSHFSQPWDLVSDLFAKTFFDSGGLLHGASPPSVFSMRGELDMLPRGERTRAETVWERCS